MQNTYENRFLPLYFTLAGHPHFIRAQVHPGDWREPSKAETKFVSAARLSSQEQVRGNRWRFSGGLSPLDK
jgi:hypothetical protein